MPPEDDKLRTTNIDPVHFALTLVARAVMAGVSAVMFAPTATGPAATTGRLADSIGGAIAIRTLDAHVLGYLCAGLVLFVLVAAEWARLMTDLASISVYLDSCH